MDVFASECGAEDALTVCCVPGGGTGKVKGHTGKESLRVRAPEQHREVCDGVCQASSNTPHSLPIPSRKEQGKGLGSQGRPSKPASCLVPGRTHSQTLPLFSTLGGSGYYPYFTDEKVDSSRTAVLSRARNGSKHTSLSDSRACVPV